MNENPYASPEIRDASPLSTETEFERIRRKHINTETSLRTLGTLYYFGFIGCLAWGIIWLNAPSDGDGVTRLVNPAIALMLLILALVQLATGFALRKFRQWSRIPAGLLCIGGLFWFPAGTIINGYLLYLIFGKKGRMVFSSNYQEIVAATPHIKSKTSIIAKIAVAVLLFVLLAMAILLAMHRSDMGSAEM